MGKADKLRLGRMMPFVGRSATKLRTVSLNNNMRSKARMYLKLYPETWSSSLETKIGRVITHDRKMGEL